MIIDHTTQSRPTAPIQDMDLERLRQAGRQLGKNAEFRPPDRADAAALKSRSKQAARVLDRMLSSPENRKVHLLSGSDTRWVAENYRLIRTALKEARQLTNSLKDYRSARLHFSDEFRPLPYVVAGAYLSAALDYFSEDGLVAFLEGFQETHALDINDLWALKLALQVTLLERIAGLTPSSSVSGMAVFVTSLRSVSESQWKELIESASVVHAILASDPSGYYTQMDYASRDLYRGELARLAKQSKLNEAEVAQQAIQLSSEARIERQRHVGYWLVDAGVPVLRRMIGYRTPFKQRLRDSVLAWPQSYYLIGVEVLTMIIVVSIMEARDVYLPALLPLLLLILPATQAAVDFMNNLTSYLLRPRQLPKLDFADGIPDEYMTMIAVPTLLLTDKQVRQLVTDLEIRYLANRDENLRFALVTDGPDSDAAEDARDYLVDLCTTLIEGLNQRYSHDGNSPFYLFHRHRTYNASEGRWMGWERKRGKLLDLNQLLRGGFDSFPVKVGDLTILNRIRYILTLDSDTQLPRDSAQKMVGCIAHPLHRAVIDPISKMVVAGYGILQPRIGISIDSASSSRLASIYSGQTGFDIYTRAISDVYQDLFSEGIFTGKGIYDIDALRAAIDDRFPENALLSHDLIEGAYARAGLVSDIELIDDYPSHFSAYSRRKHRWVRGDWQIMRWLLPRVPNRDGQIIQNPMNLISRWKILDNLRRSLFEPATLALLLGGWFVLKGEPFFWTCVSIAMLLTPVYANLFFALLRAPIGSHLFWVWAKETTSTFFKGHVHAFLQIVFLLHQAMLSVDAIGRSILRVFVTKRRLLEWETAAEAEDMRRRKATVDVYLAWSPVIALAIAGSLVLIRPEALPVAAPVLAGWFGARFLSAWLNRAPRQPKGHLDTDDVKFLRATALRTWRFFHQQSTEDNHWLIPDNLREDGVAAERLSPTNLGLLLNARIAAVHFGYLTVPEFAELTRKTLDQLQLLAKYRGQILNWYCNSTLRALDPQFVSTVDNGNLLACLWTLKQAALSFKTNPPGAEALQTGLHDIEAEASQENGAGYWTNELAERRRRMQIWQVAGMTEQLSAKLEKIAIDCDELATAMDFTFLFHKRRKVMSVGCDVQTKLVESSSYDLLASESRIATFVSIAKGDVPQEGWFHLGRQHTICAGERVLISWTGTMFEYLMPALWMKHHRGTIIQESLEAAVRVQQKIARRKRIPWGISESGCAAESPDGDYGYHAFGIPEIAMKRADSDQTVISPYSSFLALPVDARAAVKNLRKMAETCMGTYGFYEAVDYREGKTEIIRSWMAHHQGMSLLAICNLLFDSQIQQYFHAEPQVLATELLLSERVPAVILVDKEAPAPMEIPTEAAAA